MRFLFVILSFITFHFSSVAQYTLENEIPALDANQFEIDRLGNLYVAQKDELVKYNSQGKELYRESAKLFGEISFIDVSNSLRPLLFYQDQKQVVFLDNALSIREEAISLENHNLDQVSIVCSSINNNNVWLYNQEDFQLIKVDQNFRAIYQSGNLAQLLNVMLNPQGMIEYNNYLYLNNPETGILIFDIFGTYYKTLPIENANYFQVIDDKVYFTREQKLFIYDIKSFEQQEIKIPVNNFSTLKVDKNKIYILAGNSIKCYSKQ